MDNKFTQDQVKDITDREAKALAYLKELQLTPAAQMVYVNIGNDTFGTRLIPFLNDTKYSPVLSTDPEVNPQA